MIGGLVRRRYRGAHRPGRRTAGLVRIPGPLDRLVVRAKPSIDSALWSAARSVASIHGDSPLVGTPRLRRALVIAPHPDDETIGAGGTLALLGEAGTKVTVVMVTNGEMTPGTRLPADEIGRRRASETVDACGLLGLGRPRFLNLPDGGLSGVATELSSHLSGLLAETKPQAAFIPWFGDGHTDHRAITSALREAGAAPSLMVWAYEVWTPLPATRLVDITATIERKRAALAAHRTAAAAFELDAMLGLSRYRSVHGLAGHGFAEAFLVAKVGAYLSLAEGN